MIWLMLRHSATRRTLPRRSRWLALVRFVRLGGWACAVQLMGCHSADEVSNCFKDADAQVGTWIDHATCLMWQQPLFVERLVWADAMDACHTLVLAGYDDWRLPTINELRSVARGCAATVTGGSCGVTDDCVETACSSPACQGCAELGGPGPDGCYRPASMSGDCMTSWTSSVLPDSLEQAWTVGFGGCHVQSFSKSEIPLNTRCVR
jgi:hypothetical protein